MTVSELIDRLQQCDPGATVYLADWNECYEWPSNEAASLPLVSGVCTTGKYVVIGEERKGRPGCGDYPNQPERK